MIKVTIVRWSSGRKKQLLTESFSSGQQAMERAFEWLQDPKLHRRGTQLYAYPGVRPDDGEPIDQDWDAIASPNESFTLKDCLVYAPELDRLEQAYGDPLAWHRWMSERRGLTPEDYYDHFGVWVGDGPPPLTLLTPGHYNNSPSGG
jgi:hypothetical protein